MEKDFDNWNSQKKDIHLLNGSKFYHVRDVWWCLIGINVGFEEDGKNIDFQRPVLVFKSFGQNICLVIPLTTSLKKHKYRVPLGLIRGQKASAVVSQIRVVDTKRLVNKIGVLEIGVFERLRKIIKDLL